jgi:plasmid rolling circle replication initiator protein Rep
MNDKVKINSNKSKHSLDTLEVTLDYFKDKTHAKQYYKAIRKFKTSSKILSIVDTLKDKGQAKTYWKSYHCNSVLLQDNYTFKGSLCRKRFCTECNRIKTAELTNGYKEPMLNLGKLYFVTLTTPNVKGSELKKEIQKMIKAFQLIKNNIRKTYKIKINGIRKIEITYNQESNTYHPHFHLIQDNLKASNLIQALWIKQFPKASIKAQDIREINSTDESAFIELFKYATKETNSKGAIYSGEVLHTIYSSIQGIRIYQTYGSIKKVKAPIEAKQNDIELDFIEPKQDIWIFEQDKKDWINAEYIPLVNTIEIETTLQTKKLISLKT